MPTTWDPAAKNANVVLSGGDLVASYSVADSTHYAGRATDSIAAGNKRYWEITITNAAVGSPGVGIVNATPTFGNGEFLGGDGGSGNNSIGYYNTGDIFYAFTNPAVYATWTTGDVICVALDAGNKIWWRVNGGNWNNSFASNPATNNGGMDLASKPINGTVYPAYSVRVNSAGTTSITANFGASAFAFTPPSGFTALDTPGNARAQQRIADAASRAAVARSYRI